MSQEPCPKCGFGVPLGEQSCPRCGVVLAKARAGAARVQPAKVVVTTGDLKEEYEIKGSVYFAVTSKKLFSHTGELNRLAKKHGIEKGKSSTMSDLTHVLTGEWSADHQNFPTAFAICVAEIREQASNLGADAVVWMRQSINLDASGLQFFYMQVYGTAVRRKAG
jgi:uncharacterized protein YbjQ (UPF0145 family)